MALADFVLLRLPLAVWVGSVLFAVFAAPAIFRGVPSRDLAGKVVGEVLGRLETALHLLSVLLVIGVFAAVAKEGAITGRSAAAAIGIFLAIASNVYASMVVRPRMAYYRAQAGSFDETPEDNPWRRKFQALHRKSTRVVAIGLFSAGFALFFAP